MLNVKHIIPPFDNYIKYNNNYHSLFIFENCSKIEHMHEQIKPKHFCFFGKPKTKLKKGITIISSIFALLTWVNKYDNNGEKCVIYTLKKTNMNELNYKCIVYFDDIESDKKWKMIPKYLPKSIIKIYRYVNIFNHPDEMVKFPNYNLNKNVKKITTIYKCFCGNPPYQIPIRFSKIMSEIDIDFDNYIQGGEKPKCLNDVDISLDGNKIKLTKNKKNKTKNEEVRKALRFYGF